LATTLAIPIWLHFRRKSRPKEIAFPSLLLLRQDAPRAMQKQKLRNLLQLIIRLLLLLCLVLALAKPTFNKPQAWPDQGLMLIDNGIFGGTPSGEGMTSLEYQLQAARRLSEKLPLGLQTVPLLSEIGLSQTEDRFGSQPIAGGKLLAAARGKPDPQLVVIPVFAWSRFASVAGLFEKWLAESERNSLVLWDLSPVWDTLPHWGEIEIQRDSLDGWVVSLDRPWPSARQDALLALSGGMERKIIAGDPPVEIVIQPGTWLGAVRPASSRPSTGAWNTWHFATEKTGMGRILHDGSTTFTLAALSEVGKKASVEHLPANLPLPDLEGNGSTSIRAIFLAGSTPSSEDLEKIAAFVFAGGGLLVTLGPGSDAVALNSRLLGPLGLGRISHWMQYPKALPVEMTGEGLLPWQTQAATWGQPGTVSQLHAMEPAPATHILLRAGNQPLLLEKKAGRGAVLLWTTDIDSLAFTDIGLNPYFPLSTHAFLNTLANKESVIPTATDSILTVYLGEGNAEVLDPQGEPFTRIQETLAGLQIGPFPKAGIYRLQNAEDTVLLAANLLHPWRDEVGNAAAQAAQVAERMKPWKGQIHVTAKEPGFLLSQRESSAWPIWLGAAVMLLLLDGLVALALSSKSQIQKAAWVSKAPHG